MLSSTEHNAQEEPARVRVKALVVYLRGEPPPCAQKAERERERRVFTRVSRGCWPCLRVVFIHRSTTHKKSQQLSHTWTRRTYSRVNTRLPPSLPHSREARVHPRKYAVLALLACCVHAPNTTHKKSQHRPHEARQRSCTYAVNTPPPSLPRERRGAGCSPA